MEYVIEAKFPVDGKHWELEFHRGIAKTKDGALAKKYKERGYDVFPQRKKEDKQS